MAIAPAVTDRPRTALEVIADCLARLRMTDATGTAAALLAAWHGFDAGPVHPDDAVRPWHAPSLPYTDRCMETIDGLTQPGHGPTQAIDPGDTAGLKSAAAVRCGILALALELNTLLPKAAEHAGVAADRAACQRGARLAHDSPDQEVDHVRCCRARILITSRALSRAPVRPARAGTRRAPHRRQSRPAPDHT